MVHDPASTDTGIVKEDKIMTLIWKATKEGLLKTWKLILKIFKVIIPVYLLVSLLDYSGLLDIIASWFEGIMKIFGLPGETALVFLVANGINIYAGLAVLETIVVSLSVNQITTLAFMICFSHSLVMETSILKSVKIPRYLQILIRIFAATLIGLILNLVWKVSCYGQNNEIHYRLFSADFRKSFLDAFKDSDYNRGNYDCHGNLEGFESLELAQQSTFPFHQAFGHYPSSLDTAFGRHSFGYNLRRGGHPCQLYQQGNDQKGCRFGRSVSLPLPCDYRRYASVCVDRRNRMALGNRPLHRCEHCHRTYQSFISSQRKNRCTNGCTRSRTSRFSGKIKVTKNL